jgi:hypothetical protein
MSSQDPCENSLTTKEIKQSSNFKDEEDICLIDAWINTSMDLICENE